MIKLTCNKSKNIRIFFTNNTHHAFRQISAPGWVFDFIPLCLRSSTDNMHSEALWN